MKKIFIIAASALLLTACGGNKNEKASGENQGLFFQKGADSVHEKTFLNPKTAPKNRSRREY